MKTIRVVAAVIRDGEKIFATMRGYGDFKGLWEFPGGKIEAGEAEKDTVKRELKEELNLDVKVGGLFAKTTFEYPDFVITLSVYECEMLSSFVLKEHESYRWMPPAELKAEEWAPADADMVESIKRVFGE